MKKTELQIGKDRDLAKVEIVINDDEKGALQEVVQGLAQDKNVIPGKK